MPCEFPTARRLFTVIHVGNPHRVHQQSTPLVLTAYAPRGSSHHTTPRAHPHGSTTSSSSTVCLAVPRCPPNGPACSAKRPRPAGQPGELAVMTWLWLSTHCCTSVLVGRSRKLGRRHACTSSFRSGCKPGGAPAQSTRALHTGRPPCPAHAACMHVGGPNQLARKRVPIRHTACSTQARPGCAC